ncbi:MAG: hypothetical protein COT24_05605 [Candidatus Kerfeldbacteria bacterium CG08_land_8_20_14_0_20_40_16]|uniref:Helix-turn-helix domain-containing protein n=1 Tax=Candidatus Kerfeldbacteria bacterium CG08_land_8_20_14_0_20_40_16 TaxID=2014244 RepID=A0A2H0YUR0_9BACT|nr:MAG: hypothetical protein COT24_05605 [Candidatus Kerfeldbacteria bacterium CG08_land_8_20_14_0_20_40_16]
MNKEFSIKEAAILLDISIQTLRRWDKSGRFIAQRKKIGKVSRYYYRENDIEDLLATNFPSLLKVAKKWALDSAPPELPRRFYCPDSSIFKARLSGFEYNLSQDPKLAKIFPLIVAVTGEIGNNSFDHNLGNWPDVPGIFFGYNLNQKEVILADRGQGFLKTLQRVRPSLSDYSEALKVAFTEFLSGRSPEKRGNGLKYVREVVLNYHFKLFLQSGDAFLNLSKRNKTIKINTAQNFIQGSYTLISY